MNHGQGGSAYGTVHLLPGGVGLSVPKVRRLTINRHHGTMLSMTTILTGETTIDNVTGEGLRWLTGEGDWWLIVSIENPYQ